MPAVIIAYDYEIACAFALIFCTYPAGIIIRKILRILMLTPPGDETAVENAGFIIGVLERLIILLLGILGQYSAIALVITAKGLARFDQLKDRDFAEKYLIGTLLSTLIALICIYVVNAV